MQECRRWAARGTRGGAFSSLRTPSPEEMARFDGHRGNNTTFGKYCVGSPPMLSDAVSLAFVDIYPASEHHYQIQSGGSTTQDINSCGQGSSEAPAPRR